MRLDEIRLGVNIDHVATVRNARGTSYPDPLMAAKIVKEAGGDGITAHLREDRRHIVDQDISRLKQQNILPLNLEMAATDEMQKIAFNVIPAGDILENNYTNEEMKMSFETNKILDKDIKLSATCSRVPVLFGHSLAVHVETKKEIDLNYHDTIESVIEIFKYGASFIDILHHSSAPSLVLDWLHLVGIKLPLMATISGKVVQCYGMVKQA